MAQHTASLHLLEVIAQPRMLALPRSSQQALHEFHAAADQARAVMGR